MKRSRTLLNVEDAQEEADRHARRMGFAGGFETAMGGQFNSTVLSLLIPITHPISLLTLSTTSRAWAGLATRLGNDNDLWYNWCMRDFPQMMSYLPMEEEVQYPEHPRRQELPTWALVGGIHTPESLQPRDEYRADLALIRRVPWRRVYQITHIAYRQSARLLMAVRQGEEERLNAADPTRDRATGIFPADGNPERNYTMVPLSTTDVLFTMPTIFPDTITAIDARELASSYGFGVSRLPMPLAALGALLTIANRRATARPSSRFGSVFQALGIYLEPPLEMRMMLRMTPHGDFSTSMGFVMPYMMWMAFLWAAPGRQPVPADMGLAGIIRHVFNIAGHEPLRLERIMGVEQWFPDPRDLRNLQPVPRWSPDLKEASKRRPYLGAQIGACCEASENACASCLEPVCQKLVCLERHRGCQ